jgi:glycosyltransferase involved in cell wall biosynthesis
MSDKNYVLITPARNEEAYIEKTIQAVIFQTVLPKKWVIVSDGSIDRTDEIVNNYVAKHNFMELVKTSGYAKRNFGSKNKAINLGYTLLKDIEYEYIGNLDADVSFDSSYYENILSKFQSNKKIGIAGGVRYDLCNGKFEKVIRSRNSVAGAFQLFRCECYETIGGYISLKYGGMDAVAEIMARMHGWKVESFPEIEVFHYRPTGTGTGNILNARFRNGVRDYLIGYHPLFQTLRVLRRTLKRRFLIGSFCWMCGYYWAALLRYKRPVSDDFIKYLRSEQITRLRSVFFTAKDSVSNNP